MSNFAIAPARPDDVPAIHGMIRELAEYEKLSDLVVSTEADVARALFGDAPAVEVVLGRADGIPVAFALYFHNFSTFLGRRGLYLEDLFVERSVRGSGAGRALIEAVESAAREAGASRLYWMTHETNETAQKLYNQVAERPGFVQYRKKF